jgi:hypothetical protein
LSKAQLDGRPVAFSIPYRVYVGTHNENHGFIEQKRVLDSLGEDLGGRTAKAQRGEAATQMNLEIRNSGR